MKLITLIITLALTNATNTVQDWFSARISRTFIKDKMVVFHHAKSIDLLPPISASLEKNPIIKLIEAFAYKCKNTYCYKNKNVLGRTFALGLNVASLQDRDLLIISAFKLMTTISKSECVLGNPIKIPHIGFIRRDKCQFEYPSIEMNLRKKNRKRSRTLRIMDLMTTKSRTFNWGCGLNETETIDLNHRLDIMLLNYNAQLRKMLCY